MWRNRTLAVVLPTYNEADSIAACIKGFEALDVVDEIVVVNNNAHPDTTVNVATTSAREVFETRQGYGAAIRRGLAETRDYDLVAICEPDGTFDPDDLWKLLPFLSDADAVLGSRTVSTFIFSGANMGWFLRLGNWAVAKGLEILFNSVSLSDVGCTFRVLTRETVDLIEPRFVREDSPFGLEMMLHLVGTHRKMVQVPVRYLPRVGDSSVTGDLRKTIPLGLTMIWMIVAYRLFGRIPKARRSR